MAKATVVIPVYNKEKYLRETLSSVDKQTEDDLEVIIIDDASTDKGMDIIYDFASDTAKQVKIIKNDKNYGVAYSRNLGIEESKSDYITFLDADDTFENNFMEVMLHKAKKYPFVDFVRGNVRPFSLKEGYITYRSLDGFYEEQIIIPRIVTDYLYREINSINSRLYKSDFVKNLRFVESSFEDYEFSLDTIIECNSILYTNQAIYNYRIVTDGKNHQVFENLLKAFCDYEVVYNHILEKHSDIPTSLLTKLNDRQAYLYINYLNVIFKSKITTSDKESIIENCLLYLYYKYQLDGDSVTQIINKPIPDISNPNELKQKIKEILMKY